MTIRSGRSEEDGCDSSRVGANGVLRSGRRLRLGSGGGERDGCGCEGRHGGKVIMAVLGRLMERDCLRIREGGVVRSGVEGGGTRVLDSTSRVIARREGGEVRSTERVGMSLRLGCQDVANLGQLYTESRSERISPPGTVMHRFLGNQRQEKAPSGAR
ncbi:hypothetical protein BV20DRAFT_676312 [Pilatotrama ljubarskyi]|nr:hypothetical protein BV20DRAFT_676312 [Pilatotrama ljubarskyi]